MLASEQALRGSDGKHDPRIVVAITPLIPAGPLVHTRSSITTHTSRDPDLSDLHYRGTFHGVATLWRPDAAETTWARASIHPDGTLTLATSLQAPTLQHVAWCRGLFRIGQQVTAGSDKFLICVMRNSSGLEGSRDYRLATATGPEDMPTALGKTRVARHGHELGGVAEPERALALDPRHPCLPSLIRCLMTKRNGAAPMGPTVIENPVQQGARLLIPKGTLVRCRGTVKAVGCATHVRVFSAANGFVNTTAPDEGYGFVHLPTITWHGSGGCWTDARLTPELCASLGMAVPELPSAECFTPVLSTTPSYGPGRDDRFSLAGAGGTPA